MLYQRLSLENFGVFRGEHAIELTPPTPSRPIVLVGALNGSGKTTVIEALQLALYGRRAGYGWRGFESYAHYISQLRNRHAGTNASTSVELQMRLGDGQRVRVRRQWTFDRTAPKEYLQVFRDEESIPDQELTDGWDDEIERLLPARLSELFFFDGERIEELADPLRSASVLRAAMSSLLGIDLVDNLLADLEIVKRNQKKKFLSEADQDSLQAMESEELRIAEQFSIAEQEIGHLTMRRDREVTRLQSADELLRLKGQDRYIERTKLQGKHVDLKTAIGDAETRLRAIAAGSLPLSLLRSALDRLLQEADEEASGIDVRALSAINAETTLFLSWLEKKHYAQKVRSEIAAYLASRLAILDVGAAGLSDLSALEITGRLQRLVDHELGDCSTEVQELLVRVEDASRGLAVVERQIFKLPAEDQLSDAIRQHAVAEMALATVQKDIAHLEKTIGGLTSERQTIGVKKARFFDKTLESGDAERIVAYCDRSKTTLGNYRANLIRQRREHLERLVIEAFKLLTHKPDLAGKLKIDAETMEAQLQDSNGYEIRTEQLSAGERQLFAVAMLWGLAKASGRSVPVVIDTPLGRLDGEHRAALVDRYFRGASHQVILLSTDEEVDARFSASLEESVAHRYLISYDSNGKSSAFSVGYFERQ